MPTTHSQGQDAGTVKAALKKAGLGAGRRQACAHALLCYMHML